MMRKSTRQPMLCALALAALGLSGCTAQVSDKGRSPGVPTWGLLSAVALPNGGFLLLH